MQDTKTQFRFAVASALNSIIKETNPDAAEITSSDISVQTPPSADMGDLGVPLFAYAKTLRKSPAQIAEKVAQKIIETENKNTRDAASSSGDNTADDGNNTSFGRVAAVGPYVNLFLDKSAAVFDTLSRIFSQRESYGTLDADGKPHFEGRRVMVEFSSPNTNKPLHLGHMRNDALGESVSRILKKAGAEVYKVNIINNRGVHICKSMLAYKMFHEAKNETPESLGMKGDHFVGQCYVEFDAYAKEHPEAQSQAEEMLRAWEAGDAATRALWQRMNDWTLGGVKETYARTGVSFDKLYFESETYLLGKEEIVKGLDKGVFFKADDGSVRIDVTAAVGKSRDGGAQEKVLLRKDGTSVYITQDIGTAISRHDDWNFNQLVYVVASEQVYHFKVLFFILKKLGFEWAEKLYHLSYGLVNLPSGRMKSREGTVVDADDLIDALHKDAISAIKERGRDAEVGDASEVAEKVALAALHYYLLQVAPVKDMLFNPEESLSFNGNTGPYLQYMGARISSILRKAESDGKRPDFSEKSCTLLSAKEEWELVKLLASYSDVIVRAANALDPSGVAIYLYDVAKSFSKFYEACPILAAGNDALVSARLALAESTLTVLKSAMDLVLVQFLEKM